MSLRCRLGVHRYAWFFVGTSWRPDNYIRACLRCGRQEMD